MTKGNTVFDKFNRKRFRRTNTFKATKPNRDTLSTNAKRKEKNSKFFFAEHVVNRDMDFVVRMFNRIFRNNKGNERGIEGISKRRKRRKEAPEATFNRFEMDQREGMF